MFSNHLFQKISSLIFRIGISLLQNHPNWRNSQERLAVMLSFKMTALYCNVCTITVMGNKHHQDIMIERLLKL